METVVGDISRGVKQLECVLDVSLKDCCDELTRGVVEGLWRRHNPQHQLSSSQGKPDIIALASTSLKYAATYTWVHFTLCTDSRQ